jgi:hypothetical protein
MQTIIDPVQGIFQAARSLEALIASGAPVSRKHLNTAMEEAFGGDDASGAWTQRQSFDALETAMTLTLLSRAEATDIATEISELASLVARLPTHTVRSEEQYQLQQFSTPADIAGLAAHLAAIGLDDLVLEPSAGTGLLAAFARRAGARLQLNEYDPVRAGLLRSIFNDPEVTEHDGARIATLRASDPRPSVILINPPFSMSLGRGEDRNAAARHLASALNRLARGGRAVAIMPDWFAPGPRMEQVFRTTLDGMTVSMSLRLDSGAYAKHGTSVAVRIYVIDKLPGQLSCVTINRASAADLLAAIAAVPPRAALAPMERDTGARPAKLSLFRSVKSAVPRPVIIRAPQRNEVADVRYTVLNEPAPAGEQQGVYSAYRPSRVAFTDAGEHPTLLVESAAMASINAPRPSYVPRLPEQIVARKLLSAAQLETVVYAGEAWSRTLPGRFVVDPKLVQLQESAEGRAYRCGFFLGDGTGAGKGRQAAACIMDQWLRGKRKHLWISKNAPLLEDARRDWTALGGLSADIIELSAWKIGQTISAPEGILFIPYGTLRSQRVDDTRLDQIIEWAGDAFDGVIVLDEAHELGGVAGGEGTMGKKDGSLQGIAGVMLQNRLPDARVLYASATGASDINNLAYAVRLGLWGPGTAFGTREKFITEIREGGIAAMELVARDLKASGLYLSRALSFAGVEYDILQHDLTPDQIAIYDQYSDAWSIIHRNMEEALDYTGIVDALEDATLNSQAKAAARSRFEGAKQRFFGQILLSMKLPSLFPAIDAHLTDNESVVIQLVSTAEAILDRRLADLEPDEREALDIDLSPRELCIDYLRRAFPTRQMEEYQDDTGETRSRPMFDTSGNAVYNERAEAARDALVEHLCALPPIHSALDAIILRFGADLVAEVTGRSKRLMRSADGSQRLESRSARSNLVETQAFMSGTKRVLVFSDAGGTGRSYHASLDVKNQERRVHFLLEPGWRADRAIQGLGRTHRTHQAQPPLFRPVTTNCRGELRFTSTIARRLDSLGALTRGQRQTGGQNLFDPSDNLESDYAKAALIDWYHLLVRGKLTSTTLSSFERESGLTLNDKDGIISEDLPPIQRWLNRLLALKIATQNAIFDEFIALVETRVSAAKEAGTFDVGVETLLVDSCELLGDTIIRTDPQTGATSHLLEILTHRRRQPVALLRLKGLAEREPRIGWLKNGRSGKVALRIPAHPHMDDQGNTLTRYELVRPLRSEFMLARDLEESAWEEVDQTVFDAAWQAEYEADANSLVSDTLFLATGLLLPVWGALPKEDLTVNRILDQAGNGWLGRRIPEIYVEGVLNKLGVAQRVDIAPEKLAEAILAGRTYTAQHPLNVTIKTSRVNGQKRLEIVGAEAAQLPSFKAMGCFTEIIAYKTRLFIPLEGAAAIVAGLVA